MKPSKILALTGALATGLLLVCGCETVTETFKDTTGQSKPIMVAIPVEGDVAEVPVRTTGSAAYKQATIHLAYRQWPEAVAALQTLVRAKPDDWKARYALAVAQEASGDYTNAKISYIEADRLNGGGADDGCVAGVKRIEMRGK